MIQQLIIDKLTELIGEVNMEFTVSEFDTGKIYIRFLIPSPKNTTSETDEIAALVIEHLTASGYPHWYVGNSTPEMFWLARDFKEMYGIKNGLIAPQK